jgi:hypothetical protein
MVLTCRRWHRDAVTLGGAAYLALLACKCGGEAGPPDDAGVEDAGEDQADADWDTDDAILEADGDSEDDVAEDADDARDSAELVPCDASDRDVPVWERTVGECWRDDPPPRDLSGLWFEPEPGCEQISYGDHSIDPSSQAYDVWNDAVAFGYRGIFLVDIAARTERNLEPFLYDQPTNMFLADFLQASMGGLTDQYVAYSGVHRHAGRAGEAPSDGCYVVTWSRSTRMKRLDYAAICPFGDDTGMFLVDDLYGQSVFGPFLVAPDTTQENVYVLNVQTLENVALTAFPFGMAFWPKSRLWGNTGVASLEGHSLILADLAARTTRTLDLGAGDEWSPDLHERRLCWLGDDSSSAHGHFVDCMDLDAGVPWRASDDPTSMKNWPAVFGDWVAWEDVREVAPGMYDETVSLYHRGKDRRWRLSDRTTWFSGDLQIVECPRLWGDHVYFLVFDRADHTRQIFRCNLRTLFPEAYE